MKLRKFGYLLFLILFIFVGLIFCSDDVQPQLREEAKAQFESSENSKLAAKKWWHDEIFYQIWPRSFKDSDGDGIGDFKGMTSQLDYLADLGITAIWLTPIFEAPSYHGYDYQEFYEVESDYGTMEDLEEFLQEAKKRDIKVIIDLVLNHVSEEHEWFKKSVQKEEPYTDYFVWRKERPEGAWGKPWASPQYPQGYNKPELVWIYNAAIDLYYYAAFSPSQPDLNLQNPLVVNELKKIAQFWINKGVDGFRLDAVRYAIEEGPYRGQADLDETIEFWNDYNSYIKSIDDNIMLIGEAWAPVDTIAKYYSNGQGIDVCFDFNFGEEIIKALKSKIVRSSSFGDAGNVEGEKTIAQAIKDNLYAKKKG